ncbi:MAG: flagellar type III secretion system pore protein FliP, partial [Bdellovibrionales bacterium]
PYLAGTLPQEQAINTSLAPLRKFMFDQTRENDLSLFVRLAKVENPKTRADVPTLVLVPAFILSELKTAFQIGFIIFLPFLVIDIVASSVLMAMGMMMLPPVVISLPLKVMLFVLVDGWGLLVGSMVKSFG